VWAELRADPALPDPDALKDRLWPCVVARAQALAATAPGYPARLAFQYFPVEAPSIAYVTGRGALHHERVYRMVRDLAAPSGVAIRRWRMPSEAEQARTGVKSSQIDLLFVRQAWRGRGIGRHLLSLALDELRRRGRDQAQLKGRAFNREALRLYRACGFEVVAELGIYALQL
jgi:ribosomal protein S18 acetylase RimI-like enzyme